MPGVSGRFAAMKWLYYSIFALACWAGWALCSKFGSLEIPEREMQFLFGIGALPVALVLYARQSVRSERSRRGIAFGLLNGLFSAVGMIALFAAYRIGGNTCGDRGERRVPSGYSNSGDAVPKGAHQCASGGRSCIGARGRRALFFLNKQIHGTYHLDMVWARYSPGVGARWAFTEAFDDLSVRRSGAGLVGGRACPGGTSNVSGQLNLSLLSARAYVGAARGVSECARLLGFAHIDEERCHRLSQKASAIENGIAQSNLWCVGESRFCRSQCLVVIPARRARRYRLGRWSDYFQRDRTTNPSPCPG
jgi:hypothetical protein